MKTLTTLLLLAFMNVNAQSIMQEHHAKKLKQKNVCLAVAGAAIVTGMLVKINAKSYRSPVIPNLNNVYNPYQIMAAKDKYENDVLRYNVHKSNANTLAGMCYVLGGIGLCVSVSIDF